MCLDDGSSKIIATRRFTFFIHFSCGPTIFKLAMVDWSLYCSKLVSGVSWISVFYCFHIFSFITIYSLYKKDGFITTFSHRCETFLSFRSLPVCLLHPFRGNAMDLKSSQDQSHVPGFPCHHTVLDVTAEAMYLEKQFQILSTTIISVILSTKYV